MSANTNKPILPEVSLLGQEINWKAPWIEVTLWVELPFWLMVGDTTLSVELGGHSFEVEINENYFELHAGVLSDSKQNVIYQGPLKKKEALSDEIRKFVESHPDVPLMWRKSKSVLKIKSRCNEDVWNKAQERPIIRVSAAVRHYLAELCRAHIPVVNRIVQGYRLATYDYFPYEVSPWDVAFWLVEHNSKCLRSWLVPYREWDLKPKFFATPFAELTKKISSGEKLDPPTEPYKLIEESDLQGRLSAVASPGEFDLLDALNLMERGDYSGAVRRIATALEVIVESVVGSAIEASQGKKDAARFLKSTETNFRLRVEKYKEVTGRTLPAALETAMYSTRKLRHRIVHSGYRIAPGERGRAQRAVDTGRWTYNWFENRKERSEIREKKMAFRGLGRDIHAGIFPTKITPDGVVVSMLGH